MFRSMVHQLTARKLTHIVQRLFQSFRVKLNVKQDGMQVSGHNDEGVHAQVLVFHAVIETICDDLAGALVNEHGQPFDNTEGHIIKTDILFDTIFFHSVFPPS